MTRESLSLRAGARDAALDRRQGQCRQPAVPCTALIVLVANEDEACVGHIELEDNVARTQILLIALGAFRLLLYRDRAGDDRRADAVVRRLRRDAAVLVDVRIHERPAVRAVLHDVHRSIVHRQFTAGSLRSLSRGFGGRLHRGSRSLRRGRGLPGIRGSRRGSGCRGRRSAFRAKSHAFIQFRAALTAEHSDRSFLRAGPVFFAKRLPRTRTAVSEKQIRSSYFALPRYSPVLVSI